LQDIKNANKLIVNNHYHELLNKVSELDYLDQTLINNYESDLLAALEDGLLAIDASDTVALISQERNNVILVLESLYLNNYRENAKLEILDDANYIKDLLSTYTHITGVRVDELKSAVDNQTSISNDLIDSDDSILAVDRRINETKDYFRTLLDTAKNEIDTMILEIEKQAAKYAIIDYVDDTYGVLPISDQTNYLVDQAHADIDSAQSIKELETIYQAYLNNITNQFQREILL